MSIVVYFTFEFGIYSSNNSIRHGNFTPYSFWVLLTSSTNFTSFPWNNMFMEVPYHLQLFTFISADSKKNISFNWSKVKLAWIQIIQDQLKVHCIFTVQLGHYYLHDLKRVGRFHTKLEIIAYCWFLDIVYWTDSSTALNCDEHMF